MPHQAEIDEAEPTSVPTLQQLGRPALAPDDPSTDDARPKTNSCTAWGSCSRWMRTPGVGAAARGQGSRIEPIRTRCVKSLASCQLRPVRRHRANFVGSTILGP